MVVLAELVNSTDVGFFVLFGIVQARKGIRKIRYLLRREIVLCNRRLVRVLHEGQVGFRLSKNTQLSELMQGKLKEVERIFLRYTGV